MRIQDVLEKTIVTDDLQQLLSSLPERLAKNVAKWCADTGTKRQQSGLRFATPETIPSTEKQKSSLRIKKSRLKKKLESHGIDSETANKLLKSFFHKDIQSTIAQKVPQSLFEELIEFIAENHQCEQKLLRSGLEVENVDAANIDAIISRTLDSTTTRSILDVASMSLANWICKWLGGSWTSFLKIKQKKAKRDWHMMKYTSSMEFKLAKQKEAHKFAIKRLKDASKLARNRVIARKSMIRRLEIREVQEKNRERARARALAVPDTRVRIRSRVRPWVKKTSEEFRKKWRMKRRADAANPDKRKLHAERVMCWRAAKSLISPVNRIFVSAQYNLESAKSWFHVIHDHCLEYICTCCDQLNYRHSVQPVTDLLRGIVESCEALAGALTNVLSVDAKLWICSTCAKYLSKRKIPPESKINGFDFGYIEPILENLTFAEEKLVALRIIFQCIMERPSGGQYATKGGIVNVPSDFPVTVASIPRQLQDKEILAVELKRRLTDTHAYLTKYIRPEVVMQAAALLIPKHLYQESRSYFEYRMGR